MLVAKCLILWTFFACVMSEGIYFKTCKVNDCDFAEINIDPCVREHETHACMVRRRKQAKVNMTFTPKFDADTLEASLVWVKDEENELPLVTMDRDVCKYTKCPVKNGESQVYAIDIPLESKFPLGSYKAKWTFKAPSGKQCCFTHDFKLVR